jgi:hypothetical protein
MPIIDKQYDKNPGNSGIFYLMKLRESDNLHLSTNPNFPYIRIICSIPLR